MVSTETVYIVTVGVGSLLPWLLIRPVLRNRDKPGAKPLLLVLLGNSLWSLSLAFHTAVTTPLQWFVSANVALLVINITCIGVFLTAAEYANILKPTRTVVASLAVLPLLIQILAWTNPIHHLLYPPLDMISLQDTSRFPNNSLIMPVLHGIGSYVLLITAFVIFITDVFSSQDIRRRQSTAMSIAITAPFVPNMMFVFDFIEYDITPIGFIPTLFFVAWALFRADFLDVVPVGRSRAVESMSDPVVTLDQTQRVVDCNPAARELVGVDEGWEGMSAGEFFAPFPEQYERFQQTTDVETEISVTKDGKQRYFDLNISPIRGPQNNQQGTLIVLREVTPLKEREEELDLLRQVQSRVLRHNIRNDLGVVKAYNELFVERLDNQNEEMAETAVGTINDLLSVSEKTRTVEKIIDEKQTPGTVELGALLRSILENYQNQFPSVEFSLDVPSSCAVETIPAMEQAIENLVENAAEHNDSDNPTIEITVSETDKGTLLTIADNGPGIPEHELAVLQEGEETALQHGSGVGLWVVDWVVRNSTASIEFEGNETGTTATIQFPREM